MGADVRRVLIADADAPLRQQLFSALLEADIYSDCVANTGDALAKLDEERYGLMLIDVALPPGDVESVIARIHDMPVAQRPVVLVLAARPEAAKSLDVDIVQIVLRRPVLLRQLVDIVRSCLRSAAAAAAPVIEPPPPSGDQLMS
jgi:DNA-binding response OmpR family regulator